MFSREPSPAKETALNNRTMKESLLHTLKEFAKDGRSIGKDLALSVLTDNSLKTQEILETASIPRKRFFGRRVHIHVINNIRNGLCPEDCGYCAQRQNQNQNQNQNQKQQAQGIPIYPDKSDEEVLKEAKYAWESGAYRYCLVSSGRGPNKKSLQRFSVLIQKIKKAYPLQVCLSAGLLEDFEDAAVLADAGLDRYNHNLNTSREYYPNICSTHTYQNRLNTLAALSQAGISLCSGLIAGMGESPQDLVSVALDLHAHKTDSIPVNFFLPIPGHAVRKPHHLNADSCLRILSMLRLLNPKAEIRMAAGRETYLGERQGEAFAAANSLFVSGYLNVQGSPAAETVSLIQNSGYEVECSNTSFLDSLPASSKKKAVKTKAMKMKSLNQLRPFR